VRKNVTKDFFLSSPRSRKRSETQRDEENRTEIFSDLLNPHIAPFFSLERKRNVKKLEKLNDKAGFPQQTESGDEAFSLK
jgi:hypothetical protein